MKHIVIATDLTPADDNALQRAMMLAHSYNAKLDIVNICAHEHLKEATVNILQKKLEEHDTIPCNAEVFALVGKSYKELLQFCDEVEADLLVMGPHKASADQDGFASRTAINLIRHSKRPLLLVKKTPLINYEKILVAVDFSEPSHHAFKEAVLMNRKAAFFLLHSYQVPFAGLLHEENVQGEARQECEKDFNEMVASVLQELAEQHGVTEVQLKKLLVKGSAKSEIMDAAENIPADLVALGTRGNNGFSRAILGSVSEDLLTSPPCDVLITH